MIRKIHAFVVDARTVREKDVLVALLTEGMGLIRATVKHGRVSKRRFPGALDPGVELVASLRKGRNYTVMEAADVISYNQELREDFQGAVLLASSCDILTSITPEGKEEPGIFKSFSRLLEGLKGSMKMESFLLFSVDLLKTLGYLAIDTKCPVCGRSLSDGCFFKVQEMRFVCKRHRGEGILMGREAFELIKGNPRLLGKKERTEILTFLRIFFRRYFHFLPNSLQSLDELL